MNVIKRKPGFFPFSIWDDILNNEMLDLPKRSFSSHSLPAVNIIESEKDFSIEMAVPGMKKEDFKIEVEKDTLVVSSERKDKSEEKDTGYTRREFHFQSFSRSFTLPKDIEGDNIEASYSDGILNIRIPKKLEAKEKLSKLIEVA